MDVNLNPVTGLPYGSYDFINNIDINPIVLVILVIIIIIYYFIFASLGKITPDMSPASRAGITILDILLWGIFIVLILINGYAYFFNIDIITSIKNLFGTVPQINIKTKNMNNLNNINSTINHPASTDSSTTDACGNIIDTSNALVSTDSNKVTKEVFNIPGNYYTYTDAQAMCQAFDSRLASYQEIEDAYEKGADWCNYGWSQNQLALFPTNLKKWQKLQNITGHKNDCGRPGINGGFIENQNVRFGANCYGYKPKITSQEQLLMKDASLYPKTVDEFKFDQKVSEIKNNLSDILISPFNNKTWSVI